MEKNKATTVAEAIRDVKFGMCVTLVFGVAFLLLSVITVVSEINFSNDQIQTAKVWHHIDGSERTLYPSEGIDYQLEARVANDITAPGDWYREFIAANYGDTIEVRLKVTTADATDLDVEDIRYRMRFRLSYGLELLEAASEHQQFTLPDGSLADYYDGVGDERSAYVAVGTFKFTSKDWWRGRSASVMVPANTDMFTKLEVIAPGCEVHAPLAVLFVVANVTFLVILPISFGRRVKHLREHPEELEDLDAAE